MKRSQFNAIKKLDLKPSTLVESVRFDGKTLYVEFKNGGAVYAYSATEDDFAQLVAVNASLGSSVGEWLSKNFTGKAVCQARGYRKVEFEEDEEESNGEVKTPEIPTPQIV